MSGTDERDPVDLSVVVATRDRPHLVSGAVESALAQSMCTVEVIVVDDASVTPVPLAPDPRLRCIRLNRPSGPAAARNAGLGAARGRWVLFLDDDDRLLPHMAACSISALADTDMPPPVAAVSAIEVVDGEGRVLERRIPPSHPKGEHFSLECVPAGTSHVTKNTLVVDRRLLLGIGGFDASLASCEWIDLFLRLNPICSIMGLPTVTYRLTRDADSRFSRDAARRALGFRQLERKHAALLRQYPKGHADALLGEARMSLAAGSLCRALSSMMRALCIAPAHMLRAVSSPARALRVVRERHIAG